MITGSVIKNYLTETSDKPLSVSKPYLDHLLNLSNYSKVAIIYCSSYFRIASSVHSNTPSSELAIRNLLIFISALIPKALASVMTSILLELAKPENVRSHKLYSDHFLFRPSLHANTTVLSDYHNNYVL